MKFGQAVIVIIIALVAGFLGSKLAVNPSSSVAAPNNAYERVIKTRTLTCGYAALPPFMNVSATSEISGPTYEVMNEIGKRLGLKVEWKEETGYGQIPESIRGGRIDAFCGVLWSTSVRAGAMLFSRPTHYIPVHPCVAADSTAYDNDISALNAPDKTFAAYDGDISYQLAQVLFPKAKILSLPELSSPTEVFIALTMKKADVTIFPAFEGLRFAEKNNNALKSVGKPLFLIPASMFLPKRQFAFKMMIDATLDELRSSGYIDSLVKKYQQYPDSVYSSRAAYAPVLAH